MFLVARTSSTFKTFSMRDSPLTGTLYNAAKAVECWALAANIPTRTRRFQAVKRPPAVVFLHFPRLCYARRFTVNHDLFNRLLGLLDGVEFRLGLQPDYMLSSEQIPTNDARYLFENTWNLGLLATYNYK